MSNVIEIEHLSKEYRLGLIGYGTLREDLQSWWARAQGKEDPNSMLFSNGQSADSRASDHILALNDINLSVERGERLGIIGKNGAGKTTLLKILSRISSPSKGTARIMGRVASLIALGTGFHPELTGRENIFLNGSILGLRKFEINQRFDDIVDFAGVKKFIDTPVKRYSSGMRVRLGFAVAAHLEPDVLIVDEVLAVGDTEFQKKALGKMKSVSKDEGRTILFVSHNMPSIINLCGRAILLNDGAIEQDGKSSDVVAHYLSSTGSMHGEVVWKDANLAPGNDRVRLLSVRILQDSDSNPMNIVDRCKEIKIEISYLNLKGDLPLYSAIWLKDNMGTKVLSSSNHRINNTLEDKWFDRRQPKGIFKSTCCIPANLLIEGEYFVSPIVGIQPKDTQVLKEDVISFRTRDTGEENKRALGGWWGVVGPPMAWHTEKIEYREPRQTSHLTEDQDYSN